MNGSFSPFASDVESSRMNPNFLSPISSSMPSNGSPGWPPPLLSPPLLSLPPFFERLRFLRRPPSESSPSSEPSSSGRLSLEATGSASRVLRRRRLGFSSASAGASSALDVSSSAFLRVRRLGLASAVSEEPFVLAALPVRSMTLVRDRDRRLVSSAPSVVSSGADELVLSAMKWMAGDTGRRRTGARRGEGGGAERALGRSATGSVRIGGAGAGVRRRVGSRLGSGVA